MATFTPSTEYEVKANIDSEVIRQLRLKADDGKLDAYLLKYRHPRYKSTFSTPSFFAWFKLNGQRYFENADSVEELDRILADTYLQAPPSANSA